MRERWQRGESLHQIAQLFDRHHSSVRRILVEPVSHVSLVDKPGVSARMTTGKTPLVLT